ncbi:MAG: GFA family protein [Pseudomonadota bacterium]
MAEATTRIATCRCGQLRATCVGDPVRVSVCHCLDCQKRSGSAFAVQARWPDDQVITEGEFRTWQRTADSGHIAEYKFCPICGSTVTYVIEGWEGVTAVPVGAFADLSFPAPKFSVYEGRKHNWVDILGEDVRHSVTPSSKRKPGLSLGERKS